jgi:hypothetical protein
VRWSHPSGKGASTKGGSVTKPTAIVPREPRDRARRAAARAAADRESEHNFKILIGLLI